MTVKQGPLDQAGGIDGCEHKETGKEGFCLECGAGPDFIRHEEEGNLIARGKEIMPRLRGAGAAFLDVLYEASLLAVKNKSREDIAAIVLYSLEQSAKLSATVITMHSCFGGESIEELFISMTQEFLNDAREHVSANTLPEGTEVH